VTDVSQHLVEQCPTIISANARKLIRVSNRFDDMGLPKVFINFYKNQEPFLFLSPQEKNNDYSEKGRNYISCSKPLKWKEGEVDSTGKPKRVLWYEGEADVNDLPCGIGV